MKSKLIILLLLLASIFFTQCKKYEEDDVFIQWKKPEKRLIKGSPWVFKKFLVDDADMTSSFETDSAYFVYMYFSNDPTLPSLQIGGRPGKFELINNNQNIILTEIEANPPAGVFYFLYEGLSWTIRKLTKKEFIIEVYENGKTYRLELERLHQ